MILEIKYQLRYTKSIVLLKSNRTNAPISY